MYSLRRLNSFIIILTLAFGVAGCTKEYASERAMYWASKFASRIIAAPEAVPPREFNKALEAYKAIFEKYPGTVSAKKARISEGVLYLTKKEYDKARQEFEKILELYPDNKVMIMEEISSTMTKVFKSASKLMWALAAPKINAKD